MPRSPDLRRRRRNLLTAGLAGLASVLLGAATPREARADTSKEECRASYEEGQLLRREGKPRVAKQRLAVCARAECSDVVRTDCIRWLDEVERSIPTIVLAARTESGDVEAVHVTMDGATLADHVDGRPIEVDPGPHTFRFELPGRPPFDVTLVIVEGQKDRPVTATWAPPAAPSLAPPPPPSPVTPPLPSPPPEAGPGVERPVPLAAWIAGAAGVVGVAGFTAFALIGAAKKNDLDATCAPFCSSSDLSPARTAFAAADVSLAVGIVGVSVAATLFFTRPAPPRHAPVVAARPGGAVLGWSEAF